MAAGQPLSLDKLHSLFVEQQDVEKEHIKHALTQLSEDLNARGVELKEVSSGFRIQAKQDFAPWLAKLWEEKPPRYSRAVLETMVLIAYRQPITRGEIEDVRGVSVSSHIIKSLMERDWIRVVGHRDVPGRPALYATTKGFLDYFNLKSLDELPSLSEIKDLDSINAQLHLQEGESDETAAASIKIDAEMSTLAAEQVAIESGDDKQSENTAIADSDESEAGEATGPAKSGFFAQEAIQEVESSDALDAVDAALLSTKDVLERFERAVFHKGEDLEAEEGDLDVDDQREELAISEAVESLAQTNVNRQENSESDVEIDNIDSDSDNSDNSDKYDDSDEDRLKLSAAPESKDEAAIEGEDSESDIIDPETASEFNRRQFESAEN